MKKAERVTRVRNSLDSEEELYRRLPELHRIENDEIREKTVETFMRACPDYFWERPTSSSGKYHPADERGEHGNWLHTKRVFVMYEQLSRSHLERSNINEYERECGKAAALLHDMLKYGWPSHHNEHTVDNHDTIGADVAKNIGKLPPEVYLPIEAHNGCKDWGNRTEATTNREEVLHMADMAVSTPAVEGMAVYEPCEKLQEAFPDLAVIDDGDGE